MFLNIMVCLKANHFVSDAAGAGYTDIMLTPEQYISKPRVDEDWIERQQFSRVELLKRGTTCSTMVRKFHLLW